MRKTNVFGRKVNPSRPLYLLILVFVITLVSYLTILYVSNVQISELKQEQSQLRQDINSLLIQEQSVDYQTLEQLIPYLPTEFDQAVVYNELTLVRDMAGLSNSTNYSVNFHLDVGSPFDESINSNLKYVHISISMTVSDYTLILDYLDDLISMDRLYYISMTDISILGSQNAILDLDIYTFYME
ncbi:MAG: hypothetical protein JXL85_02780 [Bacilli bacterium]|nr:hypothetical protein [Bacilli bacterium]